MRADAAKLTQKAAAVYGRVNSEEQVQGYSIQAQLRACREWAKKQGYQITKEYLDEGFSASRHLDKREAFKEMLSDAASKNHPFDIIIVHKLDRFSRDSLESFTSKAILKRHKVRLISVQEPVVGSDAPEDAFMEHLLVGMAEFYSRNLSREIRKGLLERVRQGHLVFRPPHGYKKEIVDRQEGYKRTRTISRAVIDPKTAPIVQRIYNLFDQGMGYKQIAEKLNREGHRTIKAHTFRVDSIARILRNPAYVGTLEYNIRQDRGRRDPVLISGFYPPIIDAVLFDSVQEKFKSVAAYWQNAHAHRTSYLLSGLVKCGQCGHSYVGTAAKSSRFHYYSCQTYLKKGKDACGAKPVNKEKIERAVVEQIQSRILSEQNVKRYIDLVIAQESAARPEQSPELNAVSAAIEDAETRLRRWEEALERGLLSIEDAAQRIKQIRSEHHSLLTRKADLEKTKSIGKILPIPTRLMATYIAAMQTRLKDKKVGYNKEFLKEILKEVRINDKEVTLTYRLPLSGEEGKFFTLS